MGRNKSYNKEEVLEKALLTFWSKGYENTSMRDLSHSTGLNSYSLYAEFTDKESLFNEVLKNYQKKNFNIAKQTLSTDKTGFQRIKDLFEGLAKSIGNNTDCNGCLTVKTTTSVNVLDKSIKQLIRKNDENFIGLFQQVLAEGQQDGSITNRLNSEDLAYFLYNTHHGLRTLEQTINNYTKLNTIIKTTLSLIKA